MNGLKQLIPVLVFAALTGHAVEIHSNGRGGGRWSVPGTWHGGDVPSAGDVVVIAMSDAVVFDQNDIDSPSCKGIHIDPEGVLSFKSTEDRITLTVDGPIESYGVIKIDGTRSRRGMMELRLSGRAAGQRVVRLLQNSALLVYGHDHLAATARNVRIAATPAGPDQARQLAEIIADGDVMIDLHHAALTDIFLQSSAIDNTGAEPNERLNIIGNSFLGHARILLTRCDTPALRNNLFDTGGSIVAAPAVYVNACKLADIRGNRVVGAYESGLKVISDVDSSVVANTITGCTHGVYSHGLNTMIRENHIVDCTTGIKFHSAATVVEATVVAGAATAFHLIDSSVQLTSCRVLELDKDAIGMSLDNSSSTLLNCNIVDDQIELSRRAPKGVPWVAAMEYLIVKVPGKRPPGAVVVVRTAEVSGGVPVGRVDMNVRNSPAPLGLDGFTPLPRSTRPLILRSWEIAPDKTKKSAPFYDLIVSMPPVLPDQKARTLTTQLVEPDASWFRPEPDKRTQTMEVTLP